MRISTSNRMVLVAAVLLSASFGFAAFDIFTDLPPALRRLTIPTPKSTSIRRRRPTPYGKTW